MRKPTPKRRGPPPLIGGVAMRRVLVTLDPDSIERAKKLGAGNVSAGIRKALIISLR